jgi:rRNA maturation endonuclease Nob1
MFRALTCPSSGGKIVSTQHLVSSLSVNVCTVHRLRAESTLNLCTVQTANFSMKNVLQFLNLHFEHCIHKKSLCIIQSGLLCGKKGDGAHITKQMTLTLHYPAIF